MLPGETERDAVDGPVISSTPGTLDNTVAATVTIEHSQLATIGLIVDDALHNIRCRTIAVNAIERHLHADVRRRHDRRRLAFDAPAVTVENALRALIQVDPSADVTVAQNGSVYQVTFLDTTSDPLAIGEDRASDATHLGPQNPADLVGITILITHGPGEEQDAHRHGRHRQTATATGCSRSTSRGSARSRTTRRRRRTDEHVHAPARRTRTCSWTRRRRRTCSSSTTPTTRRRTTTRLHARAREPVRRGQFFFDTSPSGPRGRARHDPVHGARPVPDHRPRHGRQPLHRRPGAADRRVDVEARLHRPGRRERARRHHVPADHRPRAQPRRRRNHVTVDTFTNVPRGHRARRRRRSTPAAATTSSTSRASAATRS